MTDEESDLFRLCKLDAIVRSIFLLDFDYEPNEYRGQIAIDLVALSDGITVIM